MQKTNEQQTKNSSPGCTLKSNEPLQDENKWTLQTRALVPSLLLRRCVGLK